MRCGCVVNLCHIVKAIYCSYEIFCEKLEDVNVGR